MGQYYAVAFKRSTDEKPVVNHRKVEKCDYIMAKLMEHSYFGNFIVDAVAKVLSKGKCRLAWVGDYADEDVGKVTNGELTYNDVWGEDVKTGTPLPKSKFSYKGKYLVNWSKKEYISFDDYLKTQEKSLKISPIPLMTVIGNGLGGGDYAGENEDKVGSWAWDEISIEKNFPVDFTVRNDYYFIEK